MSKNAILDRRLHVWRGTKRGDITNAEFMADKLAYAHAVNQLLVYDQIVVPTLDFGIVPILGKWFGSQLLSEAIECGAIRFLRRDSLLAYLPNGLGINAAKSQGKWKGEEHWSSIAERSDNDRALSMQLEHGPFRIAPQEQTALRQRVLLATEQYEPNNELFMSRVVNETYDDIRHSPELTDRIERLCGYPAGGADLLRLRGAEQTVTLSGGPFETDPVHLLLQVAEINLDLLDAGRCGVDDICAIDGANLVMESKASRLAKGSIAKDGLVRLLELNGLPDVGYGVATGQVSFEAVWKLRQRREAAEFRSWIREAEPEDGRALETEYVKLLTSTPTGGSLLVRGLRFVLTTVLDTITGVPIAGAGDALVGDKLRKPKGPTLFIDRMRSLFSGGEHPISAVAPG